MGQNKKTQESIVKATLSLIAKHGIDKTSMAMIASEAGISKPAIYYYFSTKEELIDYLFAYATDNYYFTYYFPIDAYTKDNFHTRLASDGLKFLAQYDDQSPELYVVHEFLLNASLKEKYEKKIKEMMVGFLEGFTSLLQHGADLGVVSAEKLTIHAHILALIIDNINNYKMMGIEADYEEIWRTAVSQIMKGDTCLE
jgi:AcrR family transcriptional regulator